MISPLGIIKGFIPIPDIPAILILAIFEIWASFSVFEPDEGANKGFLFLGFDYSTSWTGYETGTGSYSYFGLIVSTISFSNGSNGLYILTDSYSFFVFTSSWFYFSGY